MDTDGGLVALFGRAIGAPIGVHWGGRLREWEMYGADSGWAAWIAPWDHARYFATWREALAAVRAAEEGR